MYQVIALDLDGTLLSPQHTLTEYTKAIIKLLINKGIFFVLASGRHYKDIMKIQKFLKIKTFIIASNGARVLDINNNVIFQDNIAVDLAEKLCSIRYLDQDIITQVYCKDNWYINNNKIENNFCPSLSSLGYKHFKISSLDYKNISKIFFTSSNVLKLLNLEQEILDFGSSILNIHFSVPGCLEIVSKNSSKGSGLALISNILNISLKKFLAFGDGLNDQDMLSTVGKGYIMKNADSRLKRALPNIKVIGSNKHNGVAIALKKIFLKI